MKLNGVKKGFFGKVTFEGVNYKKTKVPCKNGIVLAVRSDVSYKKGHFYKIEETVIYNNFVFNGDDGFPVSLHHSLIGDYFTFFEPVKE